jgi:hypothetical protein
MPTMTKQGNNAASDQKRAPLLLLVGIAGLMFVMSASLSQTGLASDGTFLRPLELAFGITGQSPVDGRNCRPGREVWDIDFPNLLKSPRWTPAWFGDVIRVVIVLGAAAIVAVYSLRRLFCRRKPSPSLQRVAEEARQAIDLLENGGDFRETILLCYRRMLQAVMDSRGILRERYMTPGEFEFALKHHGLPAAPLALLTRLFEEVRYGGRRAEPHEEQSAVLALREIVAVCLGGRPHEA